MLKNKNAYFQGTEEPTPKKKQYKSDTAIVVQPRFEEPLYRNYDLYDVTGVNNKPKHGPGAGWHDMNKFKSIKEFIAARRKKIKNKYRANDSWIKDDGSLTKNKKAKIRMKWFTKIAIDFLSDNYSDPTIGDIGCDNAVGNANKGGGISDKYLPENDFEGKSPDKLDFGRDYTEDKENKSLNIIDFLKKLTDKYLMPSESPLMGLPNGINPKEDLDADYTVNDINPEYGTTDSGNMTYESLSR